MKTWLITGVSRGLGLALANAALGAGDRVIGTVRGDPPPIKGEMNRFSVVRADMSDPRSTEAAVHAAFESAGTIDFIVNNAGCGVLGAVEDSTDEELRFLFEVDVFAPIRIVRVALPYLRKQKSGHIINISSVAGRAPSVGAALYSAAKHAIEGFSASLAVEVAPFGIHVTSVAPGQFRTDFLEQGRIRISRSHDTSYADTVGRSLTSLSQIHSNQLGDPVRAAQAILSIARSDNPPLQLLLGSDALKRVRTKLETSAAEMRQWEECTLSTDYQA